MPRQKRVVLGFSLWRGSRFERALWERAVLGLLAKKQLITEMFVRLLYIHLPQHFG